MRKAIETNNGLKGGLLKGKAHYDSNGNPLGGIKAVVTDQGGKPIEVEGNEVIINKKTVQSERVLTVKGTPKEILSTLNQMDGNGVAIGDEEAEILAKYRNGGELIKRADGSYSRRGLWDNIRDNAGSGRKPTKQMLEQEAKIKSKYHLGGDMSKHLAPNGKPSNLNHEQWHLVRTPEFKSWFGDWEDDPENSSKVVDKNGEPLILFQGQAYSKYPKGNYIFDKDNQGIFFTSSKKIANTYGNVIQVFVNARNLKDIRNYYGYDNKKISEDKRNVSRWSSKYKFSELINYVNSDENVVDFYEGIIDKYGDKITINTSREDIVLKDKQALKDFIVPTSPEGFKYVNHTYKSAIWDLVAKYVRASNHDGVICTDEDNNREDRADTFIVYNSNQIKLADGTNTTFDKNNDDIRYAGGGSISKMTPSELKEFYASPEGKKLDAKTYSEWKRLVNMTKSELEKFYNSVEGKKAGLTTSQAKEQGIDSGRESARWIMKMKDIPYTQWTSNMWIWAKKQIGFIKRMSGMKGDLYDDKGNKTRKHTALLIWGHNPEEKFAEGGGIGDEVDIAYNKAVKDFEKEGFDVTESSDSRTDFGHSRYFYVNYKDRSSDNLGSGLKVRVSDHGVTNQFRMTEELHIMPSMYSFTVKRAIIDAKIKLMDELFNIEKGVNLIPYEKEVRQSNLKDTDIIISERFGSGKRVPVTEKVYMVKRFREQPIIKYIDKETGEIVKTFNDELKRFKGGGELTKGTEHEMEHLDTLKKVSEGKITPEQAVVETASKHLEENPNYYEDLAKMERENKSNKSILETQVRGLELLVPILEGQQKNIIEKQTRGLKLLINIV